MVLAVHCSIDGQEQVLLYTRSNWKWYCKQQILVRGANSLVHLSWTKKYQLCLMFQDGRLELIEYKFDYMTSSTNCNVELQPNSGYVAVVDGPAINLTPLGKFVMPPPMYESQVLLPFVPKAVSLYGHYGVAYIEDTMSLYAFNCESAAQPP